MSERISFTDDELDALTEAVMYIADDDINDPRHQKLSTDLGRAMEKIEEAQERSAARGIR